MTVPHCGQNGQEDDDDAILRRFPMACCVIFSLNPLACCVLLDHLRFPPLIVKRRVICEQLLAKAPQQAELPSDDDNIYRVVCVRRVLVVALSRPQKMFGFDGMARMAHICIEIAHIFQVRLCNCSSLLSKVSKQCQRCHESMRSFNRFC